jgi:hypothetical protein
VRNTDEESELNCCIRGYATTHLKSLTAVKKLRKPIGVCVTSKGGGFIADFVVSAPVVLHVRTEFVLSIFLDEKLISNVADNFYRKMNFHDSTRRK